MNAYKLAGHQHVVEIEQELGLVQDDRLSRIEAVLDRLDMPRRIPAGMRKESILELLGTDKKAVAGWPRFVLLESLGTTLCRDGQWAHDVDRKLVEKCLDRMF